ncbi:MAG: carbohydrate binding domain-containing protein [Fibrobacteraceae bacterium]|nr:carbohydrate binding domain-containing protein [Fibrobacteraceae bacterium]
MRFAKLYICALCALTAACSPDNERSGIEIGNPSVEAHSFSTAFIVDYGEPDYSRLSVLSKMPSDDDSVLVNGLKLSLIRLAAYSSYYIYVGFDFVDGLELWPASTDRTPLSVAFGDDSTARDEFLLKELGDVEIDGDGLLKEVGARFTPITSFPVLQGLIKINGSYVPFVFSLSKLDSLELRYHYSLLDTASDKSLNLTIRFHVPVWVNRLPLSLADKNGDTVYFDSTHNEALWDSLSARFASSFSATHRIAYYANGDTENAYAEEALAAFDIVDSNWVSNSDFSKSSDDWILVQQLSGLADTSIANNVMAVKVTSGGTRDYSIQLIHEDIPVLKNRKYKLVFTAIADSVATITVRLGSYNTYTTEGLQTTLTIDTLWKSHEFEYTGIADDLFARLEFNLGKRVRTYKFKEVKIYRID